jgi:hypothetical protein
MSQLRHLQSLLEGLPIVQITTHDKWKTQFNLNLITFNTSDKETTARHGSTTTLLSSYSKSLHMIVDLQRSDI